MGSRFGWGVLAAMLAAAGTVSWLVLGRMDFDSRILDLMPEVPEVRMLKDVERHFGDRNLLVIVLKGGDPVELEAVAFEISAKLESHGDLIESASAGPMMAGGEDEGLGDLAELAAFLWLNRDPEEVRGFAESLEKGRLGDHVGKALEELASSLSPEVMAQDPLGFSRPLLEERERFDAVFGGGSAFVSEDGRFRAVYVRAKGNLAGFHETLRWMEKIRGVVDTFALPEGADLGMTGIPVSRAECGGGLVWDLAVSVVTAMLVGCFAFWLLERRVVPVVALFVALAFALSLTLLSGWIAVGKLSAIGVGFAAILVGLAADYGIVLYYGCARASGAGSGAAVRGVVGGAFTTACVFGALALSDIPGATQLGGLVAIGVVVSTVVMLGVYRPLILGTKSKEVRRDRTSVSDSRSSWWVTLLLLGVSVAALGWIGFPRFDFDMESIGSRSNRAGEIGEEMASLLFGGAPGKDILVTGSRGEVSTDLAMLRAELEAGMRRGEVETFWIPDGFVAAPGFVAENAWSLMRIASERQRIVDVLGEEFTESVVSDADRILRSWGRWGKMVHSGEIPWPESQATLDVLRGCVRMGDDGWAAKGRFVGELGGAVGGDRFVVVPDWSALIPAVLPSVKRDLIAVVIPVGVCFLVLLGILFRNGWDVLLSGAALGLAGMLFLSLLGALGVRWTLVNLAAVPLLIGITLDYSIHVILAMQEGARRGAPVFPRPTEGIGRALLLCAVSTGAGFGSMVLAGNRGLGGLGLVCALGIGCAYVVSAWLLPRWWCRLRRVG